VTRVFQQNFFSFVTIYSQQTFTALEMSHSNWLHSTLFERSCA